VRPVVSQSSGSTTSLAAADALVVLAEDQTVAALGSLVETLALDDL
jgi:molybdopterin biosynthesis enzyme